jgi:hypothetical protein
MKHKHYFLIEKGQQKLDKRFRHGKILKPLFRILSSNTGPVKLFSGDHCWTEICFLSFPI